MAAVALGQIWQYVRNSYGAEILSLPTGRPCICLDKIIIIITIIIIVVIIVTDFSDSETRLRRLV